MIAYLEGRLVQKSPARVVLDVGGVGYEIFLPLGSYDRLPPEGAVCRLLIYEQIREDAHLLFGFVTEAERNLFVLLLGISGVGPKIALSVLSGLPVRAFKAAVVEGDVRRLTSIPGIGRKGAERMIVELRDKLTSAEALDAVAGTDEETVSDKLLRDAMLALVALGYKQNEALNMARKVMPKDRKTVVSVEDLVRKALTSA